MIKQSLYPKTKRIGNKSNTVIITEKIDGSNLGFFKYNGELYVATRSNIIKAGDVGTKTYKGLYGWLNTYGKALENSLIEGACIFGEWLGMGRIKYRNRFDNKWLQFAKCNIVYDEGSGKFSIKNLYYDKDLFMYSFNNQERPDFLGVVPFVNEYETYPSIEMLDDLYTTYDIGRSTPVEGFVINFNNHITKYVRYKNGHLEPHKE